MRELSGGGFDRLTAAYIARQGFFGASQDRPAKFVMPNASNRPAQPQGLPIHKGETASPGPGAISPSQEPDIVRNPVAFPLLTAAGEPIEPAKEAPDVLSGTASAEPVRRASENRGGIPAPSVESPQQAEMLRVLKAGVGQLKNFSRRDDGTMITDFGTGFVVTSPLDGQPYVATSQHCVNPAYSEVYLSHAERPRQYDRTATTVKFLYSDTPVRLTTTFYRPDHVDMALVRIHPEDRHLVAGRALDIMQEEEASKFPDDGYEYVTGYLPTETGTLVVTPFGRGTFRTMDNDASGISGGPLSAIIDGKPKVTSLLCGTYGSRPNALTVYVDPLAFRRNLEQFFKDAQQRP